ncbi:beta-galactosidase [Herbiconiux daphne]|uniref:Beta-galactosidase n=1 Tax=Herbiconiux daphne TaxID=2970914 RepID=A0ABT2H3D0_9MICO|nr:beta-galactosidase [Herbiconiux daphne]MCS5734446.1 beta-galactosidase [Herbiconiux daphne]
MDHASSTDASRRIRLSNSPTTDAVSSLRLGDDVPGDAITVRQTHLERGGRPWFPVAGEYHFSRTDPARWADDLAAMRADGVTLVSTYVLWIVHQEVPGPVDWHGARDLRRFVETARAVGLEVVLRIGPWAHGETRNGGFPDWVQGADVAHRTNDPGYLDLVRPWIAAMSAELTGLFRGAADPTAPIVAIQVENELYDQPDHLSTLRRMAEEAGMSAPLWTATGWGGAELPPHEFLPVYAGYADGFWEDSDAGWPANYALHYRFTTERDDLGVGADVRAAGASAPTSPEASQLPSPPDVADVPYATCELGGGMPPAYHRRPLVDPDDVAAIALAKLASGSSFQGYYLYHGGIQVLGEHSSTQESHATGYPNDMPLRDYDFAAPLGSSGQRRRHADLLRLQHLLLQTAGADLAPLRPAIAEGDLRASLRADDEQGFVFVSTYQPAVAPLSGAEVQFELAVGEHRVVMPREPATVESGEYFVWPVRRLLPDGSRFSATAQLVTEVELAGRPTVVLFPTAGLPVEIQHETAAGHRDELVVRPTSAPDAAEATVLGGARFIVLDAPSAESLWQGPVDGIEHLVLSTADVAFGPAAPSAGPTAGVTTGLTVRVGDEPVTFATLPALTHPAQGIRVVSEPHELFTRYEVAPVTDAAAAHPEVTWVREATGTAPVRRGGSAHRLSAPLDEDFALAARYLLRLPEPPSPADDGTAAERAILSIDWVGDVGRAVIDGVVVSDQFWSGRPWEIDVTGVLGELELLLLPWNPQSEVHLDARVRPLADERRLDLVAARIERTRLVTVTV